MLTGEDARFVPPLTLLEASRAQADLDESTAEELVAYALRSGSDWWADGAVRWAEEGVGSLSVSAALRDAVDDARLSQPVRHRALRAVKRQG